MKKMIIALGILAVGACKNQEEKKTQETETVAIETVEKAEKTPVMVNGYASYGKKITPKNALSAEEMYEKYEDMAVGDTLQVKFTGEVVSVCKKKGCWMNLEMTKKEETRVRFKDYAFFVPKDIEGKEVIVQGKAYVAEISVDDLKHYAKDEGKSEAEIAAITEPAEKLSFEAEGVLIKE